MVDHGSGDIATRLLAEHVQRTEAGADLDFEAFGQERAAHADELQRPSANHDELIKALGDLLPSDTLSDRIMGSG